MPGHSSETCNPERTREAAATSPRFSTWITDELLAETRRVWSQVYGREISDEDAIEILTNIKRLTEMFFKATKAEDYRKENVA